MNWSPLAEMHLLLREHGWEAEWIAGWGFDDGTVGEGPFWQWKRPNTEGPTIMTGRIVSQDRPAWLEARRRSPRHRLNDEFSPVALKKRLKQLAK